MKDNFSCSASSYSLFRPEYPAELFEFIYSHCIEKSAAWDVGTGNGQVAKELSKSFRDVYASDISSNQLNFAVTKSNIHYKLESAEQCNYPDKFFDLIIAAQSAHWFQLEQFYQNVCRTIKQDGIIALVAYDLMKFNNQLDEIIDHLYRIILGPYWDPERKLIDEKYKTIAFPFKEIPSPQFQINQEWTLDHLMGYLESWSAIGHYEKQNRYNPLADIEKDLKLAWGVTNRQQVYFPVYLRLGKPE